MAGHFFKGGARRPGDGGPVFGGAARRCCATTRRSEYVDRVFLCAIDWRACCLRAAPRWLCRSSPTCRTARSDARVSAIGLGGWHIGLNTISDALSMQIVRAAIDRGINFFDNSWDYNDGASETRMGKALRDGYRQNVFLMTKI